MFTIQLQIVELPGHPFFIGAQFHPEFKSRPGKPSPLFSGISLCPVSYLLVTLLLSPRYTLNEWLIVTGLIEAACERKLLSKSTGNANSANGIHEPHSPAAKAQNGNGLKPSNGSLNGSSPNGNGIYVDGEI